MIEFVVGTLLGVSLAILAIPPFLYGLIRVTSSLSHTRLVKYVGRWCEYWAKRSARNEVNTDE